MQPQLFALWFIHMAVLYFVIQTAIDNSKGTDEVRELRFKLEEYIKLEEARRDSRH